jgi:anti-anti-sigma factor
VPEQRLFFNEFTSHDTRVVNAIGELDLSTRSRLVSAATSGHSATVIDLGGVTFMDCSGYGSLMTSRRIVEGDGRSFTVRGQTGQPARLLALIASVDNGSDADR